MPAEQHVETEAKFQIDEGAALPDLAAILPVAEVGPPRTDHLVATYFDTPDHRLLRRSIALRRRTGGADAGWHLKIATRNDDRERTELRLPLDGPPRSDRGAGAGAPDELVDEVRAVVGRRPLEPVATIDTHRVERLLTDADGCDVAVVTNDDVTSRRPGAAHTEEWRELEIELVDGDRRSLDELVAGLRRAGLRPSPYPSKLAHALDGAPDVETTSEPWRAKTAGGLALAYLCDQVDEMVRRDADVRADRGDGVHKMRVATRRLRSTLASYRRLFHTEVTEPLRAELKWIGSVLGEARDAEVLRDRLQDEAADLDVEMRVGPVQRRIDTELGRRWRDARVQLTEALETDRYFALLDALDELLADPPLRKRARTGGRGEVARRVRHSVTRVRRAAHDADGRPDGPERDRARHDVRKAAKRARYAAEASVPMLGVSATELAERMEDLQELLGEVQDSVTARAVLRQLGMIAHLSHENGFTFGVLIGVETIAAQEAMAAYPRQMRRAMKARV